MKKVVLVTGAAKGIGAGIVKELAKEQYDIILNYNRSGDKANDIQRDLLEAGIKIEKFKADILDKSQVNNMLEFCLNRFGRIDILINNAGISQIKPFLDLTYDDWYNMININLNGLFNITKRVSEEMVRNKSGSIINISSIWGLVGASCEVHYSTAKAGVNGFTKALAKELAPSNIRVNAIAPGIVNTDMTKNEIDPQYLKILETEIPLGRIGNTNDIVECVKWLIKDKYTTGQIISVNGGWVI